MATPQSKIFQTSGLLGLILALSGAAQASALPEVDPSCGLAPLCVGVAGYFLLSDRRRRS